MERKPQRNLAIIKYLSFTCKYVNYLFYICVMDTETKVGRKPKHDFNFLEVGDEIELKGKNKIYGQQYAYGFNKTHRETDGKELKSYKKDGRVYVKRIA